jgi:hypothetical protein
MEPTKQNDNDKMTVCMEIAGAESIGADVEPETIKRSEEE